MRRSWHGISRGRKLLVIAIELLLLPAQIAITLPLLVLGIAAGLILYRLCCFQSATIGRAGSILRTK
jgi:hypothetical protein